MSTIVFVSLQTDYSFDDVLEKRKLKRVLKVNYTAGTVFNAWYMITWNTFAYFGVRNTKQ